MNNMGLWVYFSIWGNIFKIKNIILQAHCSERPHFLHSFINCHLVFTTHCMLCRVRHLRQRQHHISISLPVYEFESSCQRVCYSIMNGRAEQYLRFSFIIFFILCIISTKTALDFEQETKIKGDNNNNNFNQNKFHLFHVIIENRTRITMTNNLENINYT